MTEEEWLTSVFERLLAHVVRPGVGRNSACSGARCCRRLWHLIRLNECRTAVEHAERYADGLVEKMELRAANDEAIRASGSRRFSSRNTGATGESVRRVARATHNAATATDRVNTLAYDVTTAVRLLTQAEYGTDTPQPVHADFRRDIFGNPFRPVIFSAEWRTDTAVALARQMYETREFSAMPILADALQDAGCNSDDDPEPLSRT